MFDRINDYMFKLWYYSAILSVVVVFALGIFLGYKTIVEEKEYNRTENRIEKDFSKIDNCVSLKNKKDFNDCYFLKYVK